MLNLKEVLPLLPSTGSISIDACISCLNSNEICLLVLFLKELTVYGTAPWNIHKYKATLYVQGLLRAINKTLTSFFPLELDFDQNNLYSQINDPICKSRE